MNTSAIKKFKVSTKGLNTINYLINNFNLLHAKNVIFCVYHKEHGILYPATAQDITEEYTKVIKQTDFNTIKEFNTKKLSIEAIIKLHSYKKLNYLIFNKHDKAKNNIESNNKEDLNKLIETLRYIIPLFIKENLLKNQLEKSKKNRQNSENLKKSFLAILSHELNTPMNAITGFSELLQIQGLAQDKINEFAKIVFNNTRLLHSLLDSLLLLAQMDSKTLSVNFTYFKVNDIIKEIMLQIKSELSSSEKTCINILLEEDKTLGNYYLYSDKAKVLRITKNLISNAVKFTEKGEITIGYSKRKEKFINIYIKDTGKGISETELRYIFNSFQQGQDYINRQYGGSGLGLSIAKGLSMALKTEIKVYSEVNKGSKFSFCLPYTTQNQE